MLNSHDKNSNSNSFIFTFKEILSADDGTWLRVGEKIRSKRKVLKLSQEQLADYLSIKINSWYENEEVSISRQKIANWENGLPIKKFDEVIALCTFFKWDISYLFDHQQDKERLSISSIPKILGISENAVIELCAMSEIEKDIISMLIEQRGFMYLLSYCCTTNYNKLLKNYIDFAMSTGNVAPTDLYIDDVLQEIDFKKIDNYLHNFIKDYRSSYFNQSFKDYNILNLYDMPPVYYQELSNYNINGKTVTEKVFNKMLLEENYKSLKSLWLKLYAKEDINDREIEIMIALTKLLQSKIPLTP